MSFFAAIVGLSKEKEILKRMYASIERGNGKKNISPDEFMGNSQHDNQNPSKLELIHEFMKKIFGGATPEDEEREREEEEHEEEEVLRIFAEQHRNQFMNEDLVNFIIIFNSFSQIMI